MKTPAREFADTLQSGNGFAVVPDGLCGRILRGTTPKAFETLTDDPTRLLIMTMGPNGLVSLSGKTGYEMLIKLGYDPEYLARKVEVGNQFKLVVFQTGEHALLATWENVIRLVGQVYPEVAGKVSCHLGQLQSLSFKQIEALAGYSFSQVDKNGRSDVRFMTLQRFIECEGTLEQARAFLYFTLHLRELYAGDGWTRTTDGQRGMREYMCLNIQVSDLEDAVMIDLDVRLPANVALHRQIEKLHETPSMVYILETGSVGQLVRDLWLTPGSSATILGSRFCYAQEDLFQALEILGDEVEINSFCSEATAKLMAEAAYKCGRAIAAKRGKQDAPVIGVGITSVVCSKQNLTEGKIECSNIAVKIQSGAYCVFVKLEPASETASMPERVAHRIRQGELIDMVALNLLLWAANGVDQVPLDSAWLEYMSSEQFVEQGGGDVIIVPKESF